MQVKIISFIFFWATLCCVYGQRIENVSFKVDDNKIIVSYDLVNCPTYGLYDINLSFIDESNKVIQPYVVKGDIVKVRSGKYKTIEWDVLKDKSDIKGNIQAIVEVKRSYSTKIIGGPSNALLSVIMPGTGDVFTNVYKKDERIKPIYVTAFFIGTAFLAYYYKLNSDIYYKEYHLATTQSVMDEKYKLANDNYQSFLLWGGIATTIWLSDIIYVTSKGIANRREQKRFYSFNPQDTKLYFAGNSKSFQFGLIKKF